MGMFDSVIVRCPKCESEIEFQSKAGDCCLGNYTLDSVPTAIARDLAFGPHGVEQCKCGITLRLTPAVDVPLAVRMNVVIVD